MEKTTDLPALPESAELPAADAERARALLCQVGQRGGRVALVSGGPLVRERRRLLGKLYSGGGGSVEKMREIASEGPYRFLAMDSLV